jgi:hypothetical protein
MYVACGMSANVSCSLPVCVCACVCVRVDSQRLHDEHKKTFFPGEEVPLELN